MESHWKDEVPMIRVYGCSDDLVEIEGAKYPDDEVDCFDKDLRIGFKDGTVIRVGYPKEGKAVWWIEVEKIGVADHNIICCDDEDAEIYSDVFTINSEFEWREAVKKKYKWE